jgi:uncharacterized repeat protein (TIGR02543 family)
VAVAVAHERDVDGRDGQRHGEREHQRAGGGHLQRHDHHHGGGAGHGLPPDHGRDADVVAPVHTLTVYEGGDGERDGHEQSGGDQLRLGLYGGLTVYGEGTGNGTVTSDPIGIHCTSTAGAESGDCAANFVHGTTVTLTAAASAGSVFTGWSGACTGTSSTCQVTMDAAKTVTATFQLLRTLTVAKAGTGSGTVTSNPAGISCGSACEASYAHGTHVSLSAVASSGSYFDLSTGWGGCSYFTDTGITRYCVVVMDASRTVTATFTAPLGVSFGPDQFALIPAGTFQMGSTNGEGDELPVHTVNITKAFYMQKTQVTQGQWKAVMGSNPSYFSSCGDTCPVERVTWNDIQQFLAALNAQDPGKSYRLPTEAEWEYACRAGTTGDYGGTGVLDQMGWYDGNSGGQTHPVAQKQPNHWGLFDMHGNVREWVQDWYSSTYYSVSPTNDPPGPTTGSYRVLRGGGWGNSASIARSAYRGFAPPGDGFWTFGFRLARTQ